MPKKAAKKEKCGFWYLSKRGCKMLIWHLQAGQGQCRGQAKATTVRTTSKLAFGSLLQLAARTHSKPTQLHKPQMLCKCLERFQSTCVSGFVGACGKLRQGTQRTHGVMQAGIGAQWREVEGRDGADPPWDFLKLLMSKGSCLPACRPSQAPPLYNVPETICLPLIKLLSRYSSSSAENAPRPPQEAGSWPAIKAKETTGVRCGSPV